jgi:hypothetical protein
MAIIDISMTLLDMGTDEDTPCVDCKVVVLATRWAPAPVGVIEQAKSAVNNGLLGLVYTS